MLTALPSSQRGSQVAACILDTTPVLTLPLVDGSPLAYSLTCLLNYGKLLTSCCLDSCGFLLRAFSSTGLGIPTSRVEHLPSRRCLAEVLMRCISIDIDPLCS
jgi:hypothetical protein